MRTIKITLNALFLLVLTLFHSSCTQKIYQIYEVESTNLQSSNKEIIFSNNDCEISYNLWSATGNLDFLFKNKTEHDIYIDMTRSFFIRNGIAYDYYSDIEYTRTTTTMTTTTTDPSQFVFAQKSYKIELPDDRTTMTVEIDGAATASIGGGLGYGTSADDWVNINWSGNADSTGKLVVELDISDIPASIKTAEFQIWWSNVWNAATESATDKDCDMVDYTFGGSAPADVDYGDANEDGTVNLADAILIMQHKANPAKYEISEQGALNADVFDPGDGITNRDALAIQGYLLGLTEKLPVYGKDVVPEI